MEKRIKEKISGKYIFNGHRPNMYAKKLRSSYNEDECCEYIECTFNGENVRGKVYNDHLNGEVKTFFEISHQGIHHCIDCNSGEVLQSYVYLTYEVSNDTLKEV